jgi:tetratricopeptide (TPR) repeat protein
VNEPDPLKSGTMLMEFIAKYPKSTLRKHVEDGYGVLLFKCSEDKKYQELLTLSDQWLKIHPKNQRLIAYKATAANQLGKQEICVQCMIELYEMEPSGLAAYEIAQKYKEMNNLAKLIEWTEKIHKYPEYAGEFGLPLYIAQKYADSKNFPKASEYCQLTLKSIDAAKLTDATAQEQARKVRRACHHLIGVNLFESGRFQDAMKFFQQALKIERYGDAYYYIGLCEWKLSKVEEAIDSFAKAEILGGESKAKAKEHLETLYKSLHDNTLIGIDKVYKRAKEALG